MDDNLANQSMTFTWKTITSNISIISSSFYRTTFLINMTQPLHSFLLTDNWGHGFVMINGFNIKRYSEKGPQRTLYVPAHILKQRMNEVLVFESDQRQTALDMTERKIIFLYHHIWIN